MKEIEELGPEYNCLKLENQICFPVYAASRHIVNRYKPMLDELDLTYTQYITLLVLWHNDGMSVKELGNKLFLDSGTLTPVLNNLESKKLVRRKRSREDERSVNIVLTEKGRTLKDKALDIPAEISGFVNLTPIEASQLYKLLYKVLGGRTLEESKKIKK